MIKEKLISKSTAKLAKEKGFNVPTFTNYCLSNNDRIRLFYGEEIRLKPHNNQGESWAVRYELHNHNRSKGLKIYSAPSQSLLQQWLREVHKLHAAPVSVSNGLWECWIYTLDVYKDITPLNLEDIQFKSYEDALEEGLRESLKLIP